MPSLLAPLILQPTTPNCANEQPSLSQQIPQTTRNALQLPITPLGGHQPQMQLQLDQNQLNLPQQAPQYQQQAPFQLNLVRPQISNLAPMTPQMGGNLAYLRRQPVRLCHDETICNARYGVCIRKTQYRRQQEDRVSKHQYFRGTNDKYDPSQIREQSE